MPIVFAIIATGTVGIVIGGIIIGGSVSTKAIGLRLQRRCSGHCVREKHRVCDHRCGNTGARRRRATKLVPAAICESNSHG